MSGFAYFLPNAVMDQVVQKSRLVVDTLRQYQLATVLADCVEVPEHAIVVAIPKGPDNLSGVMMTPVAVDGSHLQNPTYDPDTQHWHNAAGVWIATDRGAPPEPKDLVRRDPCDGYFHLDTQGRQWLVPVVRGIDNAYGTLPCEYEFDNAGKPSAVIMAQHKSLWNDSAKVWDWAYAGNESKTPDSFIVKFVVACLQVNYRIGYRELNVLRQLGLGVFDTRKLVTWAGCAVDGPAVIRWKDEKKTVPSLPQPAGPAS